MRGRTESRSPRPQRRKLDLLIDLHGAQSRGKGGAGAAGDDDAGHQRANLAHHADGDEVGDEDLGADHAQLVGTEIGENQPDQETDHRHDGQCLRAGFLDLQPHIAAAKWARRLAVPRRA
jgi:hypothetical protein